MAPTTSIGKGVLEGAHQDLSHQEMDRLMTSMEEIWQSFTLDGDGAPTGVEWLPAQGVGEALCKELGYEDTPEFEDALKGTFADFLARLPHVETRVHEGSGNLVFRIKPDPPREEWRAVRMTVVVRDVADLWRVCLKSQHARIEIPELEFEISSDGKRHIDSIYNHIASAVYNLGNHVRQCKDALSADHADKIMDTVIALNAFLDVPKPWTWVLHDPSGISEMKPLEGVLVEHPGDAGGDAGAAAGAAADGAAAPPEAAA